ncbi:MAG: XRE family transcriptional regulator [Acutalibacteraceae bacterium]|nr:helix-turn-helix domain-containing protein [Clostridia bacterium]MBQ5597687.1 helix-turn-helix domain-containing protein [Clostridia bacterium]MEE1126968.1 XRE family transcriptional regulator [Acutalibacteraceae bacterium]
MPIGNNIKRLRAESGLTQDRLGELVGVTGKAVCSWELGLKTPRMPVIERLADLFGVSKTEIIEDAKSTPVSPITRVPILGRVAAGSGCLADDNLDGYENVPTDILSTEEEYILLNVKGDSMSPKIEEGDRLLIQLQPSVDSGSYAVVLIDDEDGVVKKVCYSKNRIELISENPYYPPRIFEDSEVTRVRVVGLVKYIFRKV